MGLGHGELSMKLFCDVQAKQCFVILLINILTFNGNSKANIVLSSDVHGTRALISIFVLYCFHDSILCRK